MSIDEGVIKFDFSDFTKTDKLTQNEILEIETYRRKLYKLDLIGEYKDIQIGYGNLSKKVDYSEIFYCEKPQFLISGTQTGCFSNLTGEHYTKVINYNLEKNSISVHGPILASSESLTHASIYECNININAVIHIHNKAIWQGILDDNLDHTGDQIPYGTLQMANEVKKVINAREEGFLAMAGHDEGVITYASSFERAMQICLELNQKYNSL